MPNHQYARKIVELICPDKHPVPLLLPLSRAGSGKLDPNVVYYAESARTVHPNMFWEPNTQQKLPQIPPKIEIMHARAQGPVRAKVEGMTTCIRMGGTTEKQTGSHDD